MYNYQPSMMRLFLVVAVLALVANCGVMRWCEERGGTVILTNGVGCILTPATGRLP